jgi:predicted RNA-binding protein with PUA-like domain
MPRAYFLMKSEPVKYPWDALERDKKTIWEGVRNFEARNAMRAMKKGDLAFFYHSNEGKEIVGVMKVVGEARPDPTAPGEDWSIVEVAPVARLASPVSLAAIKDEPRLEDIALLKRSRLSVVSISKEHFEIILKMGKTKLPKSA